MFELSQLVEEVTTLCVTDELIGSITLKTKYYSFPVRRVDGEELGHLSCYRGAWWLNDTLISPIALDELVTELEYLDLGQWGLEQFQPLFERLNLTPQVNYYHYVDLQSGHPFANVTARDDNIRFLVKVFFAYCDVEIYVPRGKVLYRERLERVPVTQAQLDKYACLFETSRRIALGESLTLAPDLTLKPQEQFLITNATVQFQYQYSTKNYVLQLPGGRFYLFTRDPFSSASTYVPELNTYLTVVEEEELPRPHVYLRGYSQDEANVV